MCKIQSYIKKEIARVPFASLSSQPPPKHVGSNQRPYFWHNKWFTLSVKSTAVNSQQYS